MVLFLIVFGLGVVLGALALSAWSDFRAMIIPNSYSLLIIGAFVQAYAADAFTGEGVEFFYTWPSHLIAGTVMFTITLGLFMAKMIGAGDSKLCSAVALWVGLPGLPSFLFFMTLCGAMLGIATKVMNKRVVWPNAPDGSWPQKAQSGFMGVPYGIAILIGAMIAFYQLNYFSLDHLMIASGLTEMDGSQ